MMRRHRCQRQLHHSIRSLLALVCLTLIVSSAFAVRQLRIVSPLSALTIWDADVKETVVEEAPRQRFLPRFRAGLQAEVDARKEWIERRKRQKIKADTAAASGDSAANIDWAAKAQAMDRRMKQAETVAVERAYDQAVAKYDAEHQSCRIKKATRSENQFQFVGVINPSQPPASKSSEPAVTWYARKKPKGAKWSVRLVHVDRDAIIKDLFNRGKVDIFAKYETTGTKEPETNRVVVKTEYSVRERSWKNLWNFSPKHFITDSSGMYWRERRLRPGLYTDGSAVYEATYRYRDGRNGMRSVSSFAKYLGSKAVPQKQKDKIIRRLQNDTPDVVLE